MLTTIALALSLVAQGLTIDPRVQVKRDPEYLKSLVERDNSCKAIQPLNGSPPDPTQYINGKPGACPVKNAIDKNGDCTSGYPNSPQPGSVCASYCEVRVYWRWGTEVPINEFGQCAKKQACEYTTTKSIAIAQSYEFNTKFGLSTRDVEEEEALQKRDDGIGAVKASFDIGSSYTYTTTKTTATGLTLHRPEDTLDWCGHWTFVPIFVTSCGTLSTVKSSWNALGGTAPFCPSKGAKSTGNYCNTMPFLDENGNQAGQTVFVLIDCATGKLAPKEKQNPVYQYDGVALTPFP